MPIPLPPSEPGPCRQCRRCVQVCEAGAILFVEGRARIQGKLCLGCAQCTRVCPLTTEGIRCSLYTPLTPDSPT